MNKLIYKYGGNTIIFFLFLSMLFIPINNSEKDVFSLPIENEYRLKFVDSYDYELGLSGTLKIIYPVQILKVAEDDGYINIKTYENSIIYAPFDCLITSVSNNEMELKLNKIVCRIKNIISGVGSGQSVQCGEVVGTVRGDLLQVKVFWGGHQLSLSEIEAMI